MNQELKPSLNQSVKAERPNYARRKALAIFLGIAVLGGSAYGVEQGLDAAKHNRHIESEKNDFAQFDLANPKNAGDLAMIMKKDHITEDELVRYKVQGEYTAEDVAKDMGAYNWQDIGDNVIGSQVTDPNSKAHWTMHAGQTVVLPKDLLSK